MRFKKLLNLSVPSEPSDAATKKYVDNIKSILNESINSLSQLYDTLDKTQGENKRKYIQSDGSTPVTGSIDIKGNTLYNVGKPKKSQDVATKEYADYIKASTQDYVDYRVKDIRKHVIAVTGSYTGSLRNGEHQFSFGGNGGEKLNNGFLIPHSGRIIKIAMRAQINNWFLNKYFNFKDQADLKYTDAGFFTFEILKYTDAGFFTFENYFINEANETFVKTIGEITCREAYKLEFKKNKELDIPIFDFCFDDDLPLINPYVDKNNIINIRTNVDLELPSIEEVNRLAKEIYSYREGWHPDLHFSGLNTNLFRNAYLVTILIELDPL